MKHVCEIIYAIGANEHIYGNKNGTCRIIGKESTGINFEKWVSKKFNDWDSLKPGNIISNEALFCFDENSEILKNKTGRDKNQRFRTYSHIVKDGKWYCLTKADKKLIYDLIISGAEIVSLTETGQKHIFFKHKIGFWQLDNIFIKPDLKLFEFLHRNMCELFNNGFSQTEIISGEYKPHRIMKFGLEKWRCLEQNIEKHRNSSIFEFVSFMIFKTDGDEMESK